ncbi:MAG: nitroreductase/quinone reductase family protein [Anaerolineales bacterium]|jgi:deazaflavin-dependent oxidoreductase (nitroreductase family)
MIGNDFIKFFLRTPLYVFMGDTMLITVTGRKTGKKYTTPVGFYRDGDTLWVISHRERTWWRNVQDGAQVALRIRGRDVNGFAEAILDEEAVAAQVIEYVRHIPMAAKGLGVRVENGEPHPEDAARLAKERMFVKIRLSIDYVL